MDEYARQKAEEQAILRAARQARQEQEKVAHRLTAEETAKIQERVSCFCQRALLLWGPSVCKWPA